MTTIEAELQICQIRVPELVSDPMQDYAERAIGVLRQQDVVGA